MTGLPLLNAQQMAQFVARGFLRLDGVVPEALNAQFLQEMGEIAPPVPGRGLMRTYGEMLAKAGVPEVAAGTPQSGRRGPDL